MYNLFAFIKKYNAVILFILLEVICLILVMQSLPYHNRKMVSVANSIAGDFHATTSNWADYFSLKSENEALAEQNALLLSQLENMVDGSDAIIYDGMFSYIPAHIIDNTIDKVNNFILIDKGAADGLTPDMGVICSEGVVGKVLNVSENFATVMSVLNTNSIISCRFTDNQHVANVVWDNNNYRFGKVKDIPSHLDINKGDTMVTSGFSTTFPADIMVGFIEEYTPNRDDMFSDAKVRFSTNFSTLRHVYVIKNNYKAEIDSLCITH